MTSRWVGMREENVQTFSLVDYFIHDHLHDLVCSVFVNLPFIFNYRAQKLSKYLKKIQTNNKNHCDNDNNNIWTQLIYSSLPGFIWNQHNSHFPVDLLAQLVEHCSGIVKVKFRKGLNFSLAKVRLESILCLSISNAVIDYFLRSPPRCKHNNFGPSA